MELSEHRNYNRECLWLLQERNNNGRRIAYVGRQLDNYLKVLCDNGLIIKHITGSYKKNGRVYNAPNVYVLSSDLNVQQHIQEAVDRLKYTYKVGEFLPMTHKNKKIRKG